MKDDTAYLNRDIPFWGNQIKIIGTLRNEIKKVDRMNSSLANSMATYIRDYDNFLYHDRTISQLKNSGNFRLLRKAQIADSLMEYDSYILSQLRDQEVHGTHLKAYLQKEYYFE